jgi:hypothetical protein
MPLEAISGRRSTNWCRDANGQMGARDIGYEALRNGIFLPSPHIQREPAGYPPLSPVRLAGDPRCVGSEGFFLLAVSRQTSLRHISALHIPMPAFLTTGAGHFFLSLTLGFGTMMPNPFFYPLPASRVT